MLQIKENVNLKSYNTFGVEVYCDYFVEINSIADFKELIPNKIYTSTAKLIIGGGSNLLFTNDFKGLVIKNNLVELNISVARKMIIIDDAAIKPGSLLIKANKSIIDAHLHTQVGRAGELLQN